MWSYPPLHADAVATTDADGVKQVRDQGLMTRLGTSWANSRCRTTPPGRCFDDGWDMARKMTTDDETEALPYSSKLARAEHPSNARQDPRNRPDQRWC